MYFKAFIVVVMILLIWRFFFSGIKETLGWYSPTTEHMTRIRRTVGTANEANEIQVAPGVVNSMPILDYTYSYWDGARVASCDECPNAIVCPKCPQYVPFSPNEKFVVRGGNKFPHEKILDSTEINVNPAGVEYFDSAPSVLTSDDISQTHDLDPGYVSSRERMGACSTRQYSTNRAAGYVARGDFDNFDKNTDDKFDGKNIALSRTGCKPVDNSTLKLLYTDVMGLTNPPPSADDCEFYGANKYLYKEQC